MKTEQEQELEILTHASALNALRISRLRLFDIRKKPLFKTRDFVSLLLGHSARTLRTSMPRVAIKLSTRTPDGKTGIRFICPIVYLSQ
jgi:hypothetical protein